MTTEAERLAHNLCHGYPTKEREDAAALLITQANEIEALKVAFLKANNQSEHFEREWYFRGDEIEALKELLANAADDVDYCRQYMSEYLQNKGKYAEIVEAYRKAAMKETP